MRKTLLIFENILSFWLLINAYDYNYLLGLLVIVSVINLVINNYPIINQKSFKFIGTIGFSSFTLCTRCLIDYKILGYQNVFIFSSILAIIFLLIYLLIRKSLTKIAFQLNAFVLIRIISLFFCIPIIINSTYDFSQHKTIDGIVISTGHLSGRSNRARRAGIRIASKVYTIRVSFKNAKKTFLTTRSIYYNYKEGDHILVNQKKGNLNISWYYLHK